MANDHDDFYVGYLPTPSAHRRFSKVALVAVLLCAGIAGAGIAWLMDDPGRGVWATETSELTGTLRLSPVAFLQTAAGPVLLVEPGKFGARDLEPIGDGSPVTVRGTTLERDGHRMIELTSGDDAVTRVGTAPTSITETEAARRVVIEGEIIDTKCYLGAMKPGEGRTHAACARLCIRGGIPAGVVGTADGRQIWAIIDPGEDGVISETMLNAVGKPVHIEGELTSRAGLAILRDARLHAGD